MDVTLRFIVLLWSLLRFNNIHAFVNQSLIGKLMKRKYIKPSVLFASSEHPKDDMDVASSSSSPQSIPQPPQKSSPSPSPSSHIMQLQRPHRTKQIERIQGVWWTSEQKDQLVEIKSSYAIFDAPQKSYVSSTSPLPPAVAYPLGGTDDIVTLRTFKLGVVANNEGSKDGDDETTVVPEWIASPTSRVSVQQQQGTTSSTSSSSTLLGTEPPTNAPTTFLWERCSDPQDHWKSDRVVQGYEESLTTLLASEGPHWSASPVDVLRACIQGVQCDDMDLVFSLCRFVLGPSPRASERNREGRNNSNKNREALLALSNYFARADGVSSWSIVKSHYFSPDVCTLRVAFSGIASRDNDHSCPSFEFCLARDARKKNNNNNSNTCRSSSSSSSSRNKLPASLLFNSIMDVELLVKGKTWAIDHIIICSRNPC